MKKIILVALVFVGTGLGLVSAEPLSLSTQHFNKSTNPLGAINLRNNQDRLLRAIYQRQKQYFSNRYRAEVDDFQNIYNQRNRLRYSKKAINVNDETTDLKRTGELKDYRRTRTRNRYRVERSNAKQTFKARAICYFIEGTDANTDCLKSGVIDGQRHRVMPRMLKQNLLKQGLSI